MDTFVVIAMIASAAATLAVLGAYNSAPDVVIYIDVTPLVRVWRWLRRIMTLTKE